MWAGVAAFCLTALGLGLVSLVIIGFDTGLVGFALGFVMAALPVPFYMLIPLWLDRFEPEPWWLLALSFLWGAAVATFAALVFNTLNVTAMTAVAGSAGDTLGAVLSAPIVEELAKGLALLLLFLWQKSEFDNVTDGIVYASMVGLGFAMTENVAYYGRAVAADGAGAAGILFFLRGVMSPFAHPLFTCMTGIGFGAARESDSPTVKWVAPIAGTSAAVLLHSFWNLSAGFGAYFFVMYLFVMVPAALAVLVIVIFSLRREARIVRLHLESIVAEGVLSADDLVTLCSVWGRLSASVNSIFSRGPRGFFARGRFHRAATDLAFSSWRGVRQGTQDETERRYLVQVLRDARAAAGLPAVVVQPDAELVRRLTGEIALAKELRDAMRRSISGTVGALAGRQFEIGPVGAWLGRDPASAQIVVPEREVSKRHVWLGYRNGVLVADDRGSTNGTTVNGTRIREVVLNVGDVLVLGNAATFEVR